MLLASLFDLQLIKLLTSLLDTLMVLIPILTILVIAIKCYPKLSVLKKKQFKK